MKETHEFSINGEYRNLFFEMTSFQIEETIVSDSNIMIYVDKENPRFDEIRILNNYVKTNYGKSLFLFSDIKRSYSENEIENARFFQIIINTTFEPTGEDCGTKYNEEIACEICGSNRIQIGLLKLKKNSIPKKDISRTIGGEIVVSEKFSEALKKRYVKGILLKPIEFSNEIANYYQLVATSELDLSENTIAGIDVFDHSEACEESEIIISGGYNFKLEKEIYKCPKGHTIGLNLLSETFVKYNKSIVTLDFLASKQKIGVKRGFLRPQPLYFCTKNFEKIIQEEKLTGLEFEVSHFEI